MSLILPRSVSNPFACAGGVAAFLLVAGVSRVCDYHGVYATMAAIAVYGFTIMLLEIFLSGTLSDPRNGIDLSRLDFSAERSFYKVTGAIGSLGFVALLYWFFPEYHSNIFPEPDARGFYRPYGEALSVALPVVAILIIPYIALVDAVMVEPYDIYYRFGRWLLGNFRILTRAELVQHLLGWMCRAFFVALFFVYASQSFNELVVMPSLTRESNTVAVYQALYNLAMALGMVVVVSGNVLALRVMGTQVRSVQTTAFGWWICLVGFQPFKAYADRYFFMPDGVNPWVGALEHAPTMQAVWAGLILVLLCARVAANVSLGNRFSQLTHRGIVTNGMYRYSKHPSYICTVLFLTFVMMPPLVAHTWEEMWHGWFALFGIGLMYFLRARTEERHLSADPDYVAYALWMNEHGVLRRLGQWMPCFRYVPPEAEAKQEMYAGVAYP